MTATSDTVLTTTNLVLIALFMVAAIFVIVRGMRLASKRRAADRELERDQGTVTESEVFVSEETRVETADVPVAAAPPLDASPAAIAADLPPEPEPASTETDDLTRIKGLGPKLALKLGELGVIRYAQIADLTPEQAADLDARLGTFQGRMERDRWIEQARYLAKGDRDGFEAAFGKL